MLASALLQFTPLRANLTAEREDLRRAVGQQLRSYREGLSVLSAAGSLPRPRPIPLTYQVWRLQYAQSATQILSSEMAITDFFQRDGIDGRLLILGEPGMGKTHTLLAMGEHLLDRTAQAGPIPVLVDLSAWAGEPLEPWLVAYLWEGYRLCQPVATQWLQSAQFTLLLDGFDHLSPAQQRACAKEINTLLRSNANQTALLCCRRQVLETSGIGFDDSFNGGLFIQPLPAQQVKDYLFAQGCEDLWPQVKASKALQPLGRFPLYLTLFVALNAHTNLSAIAGKEALVQAFLHHALDHRPHPATPEERATLRWIATQSAHRPRAMRIDQLGLTWLPESQRLIYRGLLGLAFLLIFTLVGGSPGLGLAWGLAFSQLDLESFPYIHRSLALASWRGLVGLVLVCTLPALGLGLGMGGLGVLLLARFNLALPAFGWGGLVGVILGWGLGVGVGLGGGLPRGIQTRQHPNQDGIMALRNGVILFGGLALVLGLVLVVPAVVMGQPPLTLISLPRLRVILAALISAYLWFSGALQQGILRLLLTRAPSHLPWALTPWLQRWVQRRVLVQASGDYSFVHDILREALTQD